MDERNARDERRYRDDRDDRRDRRYRDERDDRDDRRYRDERDDRDDRRYRDERDDRDDRRYRDERDDRDDRRYRDERDDRDDRRYRDERDDRDDRRRRDDRDDRRDRRYRDERDDRDDRRRRDDRDDREERRHRREQERRTNRSATGAGHSRRGGNPDRTIHQLVPYALFCLSVFAGVSFFLRDFAGLDGQTGTFGSFLADFLCGILGVIAYALPVFAFVLALRWRTFVKRGQLFTKLFLSTSFLVLLSGIVHVFQDGARGVRITEAADLYHNGVARVGGGFLGGFAGEWLGFVLRLPGTIMLAIPLLFIIAVYLIGMTPSGLWQRITGRFRRIKEARDERRAEMYANEAEEKEEAPRVTETASIEPAREQPPLAVTRWSEPRPLDRPFPAAETFSFSDEEDEPIVLQTPFAPRADLIDDEEPFANEQEEEVKKAEAPVPVAQNAPAPETVLRQTMNATEEIEKKETPVAQPAARPTVQPVAQPTVQPVVQPTAQPAARPEPAVAEQEPKVGRVFAPFALPVQPFPEKTPTAPAAPTTPVVKANTVQPCADTSAVTDETDEILGTFAPAARPVAVQEAAPSVSTPSPVSHPTPPVLQDESEEEDIPYLFATPTKAPAAPVQEEAGAPRSLVEAETAPAMPQATPVSTVAAPVAQRSALEDITEPTYADDTDVIEDEEDEQQGDFSFEEPAPRVASTVSFDREYVTPVSSAPAVTLLPQEEEEEEEEEITPVAVQAQRVEPQTPPVRPTVPTQTHTPPAPRVAVQSAPVVSEPVAVEPVIYEYTRPPIDLLKEDANVRNDDFYEEIEETKEILRQTMASFNIRIQDEINYSHGPSVTRYEMRPVAGTSVRSVTNRTEDISLNLASSVRIEAPIPGKPAIGIEVPNKVRETVFMRTMLESAEFKNSKDPLDVPLGLDVGGGVRMCNLAKMPHLLVAGTTGSGKSVCINTMLVSLIYKTSPEDLRLILIDPKQIEFAPYEDVPHLYMPIVTDMQRASGALACAVQEMERRFSLIKDVGVRNIEAYNEAVKNDPEREHLPYIVIVIDEFNDLKMSCNNNDPENFTVRIAQKARAAGIHLIIGTQRPSVDVITGKLKGNIPSRIAFMVKQQVDSRTILDVNGAEALTGRGDMLYVATTSSDKNPVRIQGAYVSDDELERIVSFVRRNNPPVQYNRAFMDQIEVEMARAAKADRKGDDFDYQDDEEGGEDPKFVEAVELSLQAQKVATSLLQRRLGVGYGRAAKIIDRMEELGLVSPAEGNKPRKILPAAQGYLEHIGAMNADDGDFADDYDQ